MFGVFGAGFDGYGWLTDTFTGDARWLIVPMLVASGRPDRLRRQARGRVHVRQRAVAATRSSPPPRSSPPRTFFGTAIAVSFLIEALTVRRARGVRGRRRVRAHALVVGDDATRTSCATGCCSSDAYLMLFFASALATAFVGLRVLKVLQARALLTGEPVSWTAVAPAAPPRRRQRAVRRRLGDRGRLPGPDRRPTRAGRAVGAGDARRARARLWLPSAAVAPQRWTRALGHGVELAPVAGERERLALALAQQVRARDARFALERRGDGLARPARPDERAVIAAQDDRAPVGGDVAGR